MLWRHVSISTQARFIIIVTPYIKRRSAVWKSGLIHPSIPWEESTANFLWVCGRRNHRRTMASLRGRRRHRGSNRSVFLSLLLLWAAQELKGGVCLQTSTGSLRRHAGKQKSTLQQQEQEKELIPVPPINSDNIRGRTGRQQQSSAFVSSFWGGEEISDGKEKRRGSLSFNNHNRQNEHEEGAEVNSKSSSQGGTSFYNDCLLYTSDAADE